MKITKNANNRCGIFLFYDRDGMVDDYIVYMLKDLRKHMAHLLVVCNSQPSQQGLTTLEEHADEVLVRANSGFDVGGYREGLFYLGFRELAKYDEVIMLNYTFFGGIFPFGEMFEAMDEKDVDFWGITKHHMVDYDPYGGRNPYGYLPEHIQSHFIAVRREMLLSDDYKEFMISMENPKSYIDSICDYESVFTKHFEDLGYKWDVYVNTDRYEKYAYNPGMFYIRDLLEKDRCPIMKRRSFFTNYRDFLINTTGEPSIEAYDYLREHTDYDVNMIWDNILRLENMTEVSKAMHLSYFLPEEIAFEEQDIDDVYVAIWVKDAKKLAFYEEHLLAMPKSCRIGLFGAGEEVALVKGYVQECKELQIIDRPLRTYQEFMRALQEQPCPGVHYYVCQVIDTMETVRPYSNVVSNSYKDYHCTLASEDFVSNVKTTFRENPRMGLGIPPVPNFGEYFALYADAWGGHFEEVSEYMKKLDVRTNISSNIMQLFPSAGAFWITEEMLHGDKLMASVNIPVSDEVFFYSLVSLVQSQMAYTGVLYSNQYAAIDITNEDHMMRELNKVVFKKYGPNFHDVVLDRVRNNATQDGTDTWKGKTKQRLKKALPDSMYQKGKKIYFKLRGRE